MLKKLLSTTALALCAAGFVTAAHAADLPQKPAKLVTYQKQQSFDGFYLRGDVGYAIPVAPTAVYGGSIPFLGEDLSNTWLIGAGVGYVWNEYFRTDITADYQFKSKFKGHTLCGGGCTPTYSDERDSLQTTTVLANAYYDFGRFSGFTPYIGAGVGFAGNKMSGLASTNPVGSGSPRHTFIGGDTRWGLAAAAMAGISYNLSQNLLLDTNYRYLWLDEARTKNDSIGKKVVYSDLAEHQVRLGLRYMFQ